MSGRLAAQREGSDREYLHGGQDIHEADLDFQRRVREVYLRLCRKDPAFLRVDCCGTDGQMPSAEEVFERIRKVL